jgi:DNA-binding HxlR family transcriptional regulator
MPETGCCSSGNCPAAVAIHLIGSELKLVVMHSMMAHGRRFNELRELTDVCQSSLTRTLRELEDLGLAERLVHSGERPVAVEYHLTPMGQDLSIAIEAFERWTEKWWHALEPHAREAIA